MTGNENNENNETLNDKLTTTRTLNNTEDTIQFELIFLFCLCFFSVGLIFLSDMLGAFIFVNFVFTLYFFYYSLTLKKAINLSKITRFLYAFSFVRMMILIHCSLVIVVVDQGLNDKYFVYLSQFKSLINSIAFMAYRFNAPVYFCILFILGFSLIYYLKKYLNNVSKIKKKKKHIIFKNNMLNLLNLLKIEYFIIFAVFVINLIYLFILHSLDISFKDDNVIGVFYNGIKGAVNIFVPNLISEPAVNPLEGIFLFFVIAIIAGLIALVPAVLYNAALFFITTSFYDKSYSGKFGSNLATIASSNISSILMLFLLISLFNVFPENRIVIFVLVAVFIGFIFYNITEYFTNTY